MIDTEKQVQHSCHQLSSSCKTVIGIRMMSLVILLVHHAPVEDAVGVILLRLEAVHCRNSSLLSVMKQDLGNCCCRATWHGSNQS